MLVDDAGNVDQRTDIHHSVIGTDNQCRLAIPRQRTDRFHQLSDKHIASIGGRQRLLRTRAIAVRRVVRPGKIKGDQTRPIAAAHRQQFDCAFGDLVVGHVLPRAIGIGRKLSRRSRSATCDLERRRNDALTFRGLPHGFTARAPVGIVVVVEASQRRVIEDIRENAVPGRPASGGEACVVCQ